ncbi:N-acetylmuramoyl-L-alanine amidase [Anaerotruncus colihominis]|uniref:MurNAc-LAA domain-containing protein n=1 Tax=Anaerotruncus colihominis TaxID=169435 RepID=A0A845RJA7_9FIRM|nr:N-acetylmuramoyl-L-alanine amidase [Anaerotruncus colihominis]NBI79617.1 hypothetical protein [Anaerotruncus colihominis]
MRYHSFGKKLLSCSMAACICLGLAPAAWAADSYNDFDYITGHVNLQTGGQLKITRPADDLTTSASSYFITGNSDPDQPLTMNGESVAVRGAGGSFGVLVSIDEGVNTFVFRQGGASAAVEITKGVDAVATIGDVRSPAPDYDCAAYSGDQITLSCVAPSGASVTARLGGRTVTLNQAAATAREGVPATFSARLTAPSANGTEELGPVTYTMQYNGKTASATSEGSVFINGDGRLVVQVKNTAASLYLDENLSAFIESPRGGGADLVAEIKGNLYRLSTGGWIPRSSVRPLTGSVSLKNKVSDVTIDVSEKGETYTLSGTANPMFRAYMDEEKLFVRLYNTTGIKSIKPYTDSGLFSSVKVSEEDGSTVLQFMLSGQRRLWGYDISYENGNTLIYAKYAPRLSGGGQPLAGVTIAVDAGHGGTDPGAIGIPGTDGAMEKDITLASAIAVQKRLESLGAHVVMCRTDDSDVSMNDRMDLTRAYEADLFISLHCNSLNYSQDMNKIGGTEVYYYENIAKALATTLSANLSGYTSRTNRGPKQSNFRVTLNTFAPSVLVEMGFVTNPAEYDSMTSRQGIYRTANAIGDGVLALLS